MAKSGFRTLIVRIFPNEYSQQGTSEFVTRGLEALRMVRDEHAFGMGEVRRVPSHLELRVSGERYDELVRMQAMRDLEYFFTDELMKDLAAEGMRTFGDHAIRVAIGSDEQLGPAELYAAVVTPEKSAPSSKGGSAAPPPVSDSTRVLDAEESPTAVMAPPEQTLAPDRYNLVVTGPNGFRGEEVLSGDRWIVGRRGGSGRPIPVGYRKLDLNLRETISREQARVDLSGGRITVQRIGKAPMSISKRDTLGEGESRTLEMGTPFYIDDYEITITS